jgi:hypothetical protein
MLQVVTTEVAALISDKAHNDCGPPARYKADNGCAAPNEADNDWGCLDKKQQQCHQPELKVMADSRQGSKMYAVAQSHF